MITSVLGGEHLPVCVFGPCGCPCYWKIKLQSTKNKVRAVNAVKEVDAERDPEESSRREEEEEEEEEESSDRQGDTAGITGGGIEREKEREREKFIDNQ